MVQPMSSITTIDIERRKEVFKPGVTVKQISEYTKAHGWSKTNRIIDNTFPSLTGILMRIYVHQIFVEEEIKLLKNK